MSEEDHQSNAFSRRSGSGDLSSENRPGPRPPALPSPPGSTRGGATREQRPTRVGSMSGNRQEDPWDGPVLLSKGRVPQIRVMFSFCSYSEWFNERQPRLQVPPLASKHRKLYCEVLPQEDLSFQQFKTFGGVWSLRPPTLGATVKGPQAEPLPVGPPPNRPAAPARRRVGARAAGQDDVPLRPRSRGASRAFCETSAKGLRSRSVLGAGETLRARARGGRPGSVRPRSYAEPKP